MNKKRRTARFQTSLTSKVKKSFKKGLTSFNKEKYKRRNANNNPFRFLFPIFLWIKENFILSILAGVIITIFLGVIVVFSSGFFLVSQLYIQRQDSLISIEKAYSTMNYIRGKNIFLIDEKNIRERIENSQGATKNVQIDTDFPNTLNIFIEAYNPIFQTSSQYILENGVLIDKSGNNIYDVPNITLVNVPNNNESLDTENLESAKILIEALKKNILGINIQDILFYGREGELLILGENTNIYIFDLLGDVTAQIKRLAIYNQDQRDLTQSRYIYVDARVSGKLFLCGYESEFLCLENLTKIYGEEPISLRKKEISETPQ